MSVPVAHYSPFMETENLVFISGQVGIADSSLVEGGLVPEFEQALKNFDLVLSSAGLDKTKVVKTTIFLADINDYSQANEIYSKFFGDHKPARSAVAVAALPLGAKVEIEAIASKV